MSFKNAILIMTSNMGSQAILEGMEGGASNDDVKQAVMGMVRSHFRPEFVNRVDEFVVFDGLRRDQVAAIVRLQAKRVADRLAAKKMGLELEDSAVEYLSAIGYDPVYGARPVKRAVQRELETGLAKAMLRGEFREDDVVVVSAPGGAAGDHLVFTARKGAAAGVEEAAAVPA